MRCVRQCEPSIDLQPPSAYNDNCGDGLKLLVEDKKTRAKVQFELLPF